MLYALLEASKLIHFTQTVIKLLEGNKIMKIHFGKYKNRELTKELIYADSDYFIWFRDILKPCKMKDVLNKFNLVSSKYDYVDDDIAFEPIY